MSEYDKTWAFLEDFVVGIMKLYIGNSIQSLTAGHSIADYNGIECYDKNWHNKLLSSISDVKETFFSVYTGDSCQLSSPATFDSGLWSHRPEVFSSQCQYSFVMDSKNAGKTVKETLEEARSVLMYRAKSISAIVLTSVDNSVSCIGGFFAAGSGSNVPETIRMKETVEAAVMKCIQTNLSNLPIFYPPIVTAHKFDSNVQQFLRVVFHIK